MFYIACTLLALLVYVYFITSFKYWEKRNVPTPPPSFPFGNVFNIIFRMESVNDAVCKLYEQFKSHRFAGLYFFSRKVFVVFDPELIKCVLSKDFQHFNDRGIYFDEKNDPVSAHLFSLYGDKWKLLRKKLTPAFTPGKVKYMFESIRHCGEDMICAINDLIKISSEVEIKDILARFTTDVIGSCAFGLDCNSLKNPNAEFRLMGKRAFTQTPSDAFKMIIIRSFPSMARLLKLGVFAPSVSKFFQSVVEQTIRYREVHGEKRQDFLQLLIEMKNGDNLDGTMSDSRTSLTLDEAAAQAFIFFLAGFETTSTTISFALFEMAINPEIQERAYRELEETLSKHNNKISYEFVSELYYLETIILESLRKYPPAPVFLRKCTEDYLVPGTNIKIEKGLSLLIPAMALHRDPSYYPEPEKFDPERFNKENKQKIKDYTYLPFGDGPRICIGMKFAVVQSKLALAKVLMNYKLTLSNKTRLPLIMEKKGIVLNPIGGLWLNFIKREETS